MTIQIYIEKDFFESYRIAHFKVSTLPKYDRLDVVWNQLIDNWSVIIESNEETIKDYIAYLESEQIPLSY